MPLTFLGTEIIMSTHSETHDIGKVLTLIFLVAGIIFILVGIISWRTYSNRKGRCTMQAMATVVGYNTHFEHGTNGSVGGIFYYPIATFNVDGQLFEVELDVGTTFKPYDTGEELEIMCNPADPSDVYVASLTSYLPLIFGTIFAIIGLVMLFLSVYLGYCRVKYADVPH